MKSAIPPQIVDAIEEYVDQRISSSLRYSNSEPLDDDGVYRLYKLAAEVYNAGWHDGARVESIRANGADRRAALLAAAPSDAPEATP